jgi:hypothetical protein
MEHRLLSKIHMAMIITIYHGRIYHLIRRSRNHLTEPHCFCTSITSCNILCLCSDEFNRIMFSASPWYRGKTQTKTYPSSQPSSVIGSSRHTSVVYMRYSTSSCLNPYKVFFHLHIWVSFWYTWKPWDCST